ncbi:MAG: hypothetical protein ABI442_15695 [Gemmatimonadaceae bacterium]
MDALVIWGGCIVGAAAAGAYVLNFRDLIRRGLRHRRNEQLAATRGTDLALPEGRVACPECAEAILPAARRCPYCRSVVIGRI